MRDPADRVDPSDASWYLIARKGDLTVRVRSGLRVGHDESGTLSLLAEDALVEFEIADNGTLILRPVADGQAFATTKRRYPSFQLGHEDRAEVITSQNAFLIDRDFALARRGGRMVRLTLCEQEAVASEPAPTTTPQDREVPEAPRKADAAAETAEAASAAVLDEDTEELEAASAEAPVAAPEPLDAEAQESGRADDSADDSEAIVGQKMPQDEEELRDQHELQQSADQQELLDLQEPQDLQELQDHREGQDQQELQHQAELQDLQEPQEQQTAEEPEKPPLAAGIEPSVPTASPMEGTEEPMPSPVSAVETAVYPIGAARSSDGAAEHRTRRRPPQRLVLAAAAAVALAVLMGVQLLLPEAADTGEASAPDSIAEGRALPVVHEVANAAPEPTVASPEVARADGTERAAARSEVAAERRWAREVVLQSARALRAGYAAEPDLDALTDELVGTLETFSARAESWTSVRLDRAASALDDFVGQLSEAFTPAPRTPRKAAPAPTRHDVADRRSEVVERPSEVAERPVDAEVAVQMAPVTPRAPEEGNDQETEPAADATVAPDIEPEQTDEPGFVDVAVAADPSTGQSRAWGVRIATPGRPAEVSVVSPQSDADDVEHSATRQFRTVTRETAAGWSVKVARPVDPAALN